MKKASIITLQYIDNYGSVLQTYATQEVMRNYGYEGEIVNYTRENYRYSFLKQDTFDRYRKRNDIFSNYLFAKLLQIRWCFIFKKRARVFDRFRNERLNLSKEYSSLAELKENPPIADIYVTGSDQVWNNEYNNGILGEYYLEYSPAHLPKIALSASMGVENVKDEDLDLMKTYLLKYNGISVREHSVMEILKKAGYEKVVHVIDPTLMLTKNDWVNKFQLKEGFSNYVLMYQLNENPCMIEFAEKIALDNNLKLVIISSKSKKARCSYKVVKNCYTEEFLNLVYNARYVITDSFHGTAFSFNFNKEVYVFYPPRYNTRIKSFLKLVQSEHRLVENCFDWDKYNEIDFLKVNKILNNEREKVDKFLRCYLR